MSQTDREAFLADLHVGVLSVERPGDRDDVTVTLTPERWFSVDYSSLELG